MFSPSGWTTKHTAPAPAPKVRGGGGRDSSGGDAGGGVSGRLAVRRLQEHVKKVKTEARDVQKEWMRVDKASLRDVMSIIASAREKHAKLIEYIGALESQVTTVANMALEGLDGSAGAVVAVEAEDDDDADDE